MNIVATLKLFKANSVPDHLYTVGGLGNGECWGIEQVDNKWIVYFSERGARDNVKTFITEDEATQYFIMRVSKLLFEYEGRYIV